MSYWVKRVFAIHLLVFLLAGAIWRITGELRVDGLLYWFAGFLFTTALEVID